MAGPLSKGRSGTSHCRTAARAQDRVWAVHSPARPASRAEEWAPASYPPLNYKLGDSVATREAYGNALLRVGGDGLRVVAMDGDTKNSTYSENSSKIPGTLH